MSPENSEKLYCAFPRLYRGKDKGESMMGRGFECGDGWFELIRKLSSDIEDVARKEGRNPEEDAWPEATQVKEKFGTLRFHVRNASDEIRNMIARAGEESERICEATGKPGPACPPRKE